MKASTELFDLVKSMNQSEKRYFKISGSRHTIGEKNIYVRLFDQFDRQAIPGNKYNEENIKRRFNGERFTEKFYSTKNYLYSTVLKSLVSYYSDKEKSSKVSDLVKGAGILFQKGLYGQCRKHLNRAKRIALEYEFFEQVLIILSLELKLTNTTSFLKESEKNIEKIYKERNIVLKMIDNYYEIQRSYNKIAAIWRKDTPPAAAEKSFIEKKIRNNPLFENEKNAFSYKAKLLFYRTLLIYYEIIFAEENIYYYNKKIVELLESDHSKMKHDLGMYLHSLNNLLLLQIYLRKYDAAFANIEKIRDLPNKFPLAKEVNLNTFLIFCFVNTGEMLISIQTGDFKKSLLQAAKIEKGLNDFIVGNNKLREVQLLYLISYVYFIVGDHNNSLKRINKILNESQPDTSPDLMCYVRILNLVLHYEIGNYGLIESILISIYRQSKERGLYKFEKIMFGFFKKTLHLRSSGENIQLFTECKNKLESLYDDPYEKNSLENLDLISWLESKIEKRTLKEVLLYKSVPK